MTLGLINANPVVHAKKERIPRTDDPHPVHPLDIYDILFFSRQFKKNTFCIFTFFCLDIRDPEHPYSLEQLSVLSEESITVDEKLRRILITFTPTIQHCSMATVIGLCLREKLKNFFPPHFKVDIKVAPGSHADEESVNKQLNDKERVAAAMENPNLRQLVDECLYSSEL
ncbi:protein AE7-like 1 isoform X3 [Lycium ferocissimum]|uniref:protein AE7-like 1 isoform X3 n=1 Tax=Lycium ferocissimum TaxID=112874 RepID=UPI0028162BB0|nr:protein AE7-like 1 isoform X3 [Lycium ferocissimum]